MLSLLGKKLAVVALLFAILPAALLVGQESTPKAKPKPPAGRLPAYYSGQVTDPQKLEIYKIQKSYQEKIAVLADQIKELQAKQKAEIEALLTPEQKAAIEKIAADSKAKAKAKADAKAKEAAAEKPAAPTSAGAGK